MRKRESFVLFCSVLLAAFFLVPSQSRAEDDSPTGPDIPDLIAESKNVVFASVIDVFGTRMTVNVNKSYKGRLSGKIKITGFDKREDKFTQSLKKKFKKGEDYFFFLKGNVLKTVPFQPTEKSVDIPVRSGQIVASVIAPRFADKFQHEFPMDVFQEYLEALVKIEEKQPLEEDAKAAFEQRLVAALDENSPLAPSYAKMLLDVRPEYANGEVLTRLMNSPDLNGQYLGYKHMVALMPLCRKKDPTLIDPALCNQVGQLVYDKLQNAPSQLIISASASFVVELGDEKGLELLEKMIPSSSEGQVEAVEVNPRDSIEPPLRAVLRGIVEFDSPKALNILEKELLRNNPKTFLIILDILKEYADDSLNLLLLDMVSNQDYLPRKVAIMDYFRHIKDEVTISSLIALFDHQGAGVYPRKSIVEVLTAYGPEKEITEFLMNRAIKDESEVVRQATIRSLGELNVKEAIPLLKKNYFRESNRLTRELIINALSKISSSDAYKALKFLHSKARDPRLKAAINQGMKESKYLAQ